MLVCSQCGGVPRDWTHAGCDGDVVFAVDTTDQRNRILDSILWLTSRSLHHTREPEVDYIYVINVKNLSV